MIRVRRASERGHYDYGWLDTNHTFSFNTFHDPDFNSYRSLRVMNEDRVQPGQGFGTHPHRDMEILTYVLEGGLAHKDSTGGGEVLKPGEFQRMSAGTGILHSEFNASETEPVHFYQIWLFPERRGLEPGYEQKGFPADGRKGKWQLVAAGAPENGSLKINQDAKVFLADLAAGQDLSYELSAGRGAWLQVLRGSLELNGTPLSAGDGASTSDESALNVKATEAAELMLFDLQ